MMATETIVHGLSPHDEHFLGRWWHRDQVAALKAAGFHDDFAHVHAARRVYMRWCARNEAEAFLVAEEDAHLREFTDREAAAAQSARRVARRAALRPAVVAAARKARVTAET